MAKKGIKRAWVHFRGFGYVIQLSNKQMIVTIPREITRWKRVGKGTLVKWSDGGLNRVIIEILEVAK